ncbi:lipocalin-like domain-containing protein [Coprobacter tertius]|uniref:Lipocalin-like domain-containing protein n=1 Tax=Coprobacter tertius TaxID=2944915 RepID=A0ABT1MKH0_9BACT|nr:lipocalin-like domain-containing protein [Coprobacter tertius]MCP9612869.1 lipocalin-like domain-containing protein [Coprobacter tertius]
MKNIFLLLFSGCFLLFLSCEKDDAQKITGKWQLTLTQMPDKEVTTDSIFYNFDKGVFKLQTIRTNREEWTVGMYRLDKDSIFMHIPDPSFLEIALSNEYYGWHTEFKNFAIRELSRSRLTLSCHDTLYIFRKF